MHLNRLRLGELIAGVGAALVVVSLFLDWVSAEAGPLAGPDGTVLMYADVDGSGFSTAGIVLIAMLLIVAALAIGLVVLTVTLEPVGLTVAAAVVTSFAAIITTVATALRVLLFQPDGGLGDSAVQMQLGAYLTLLGVFLCAAGGWITMKDERQDAPYSAAPELEPRPAPPAGAAG